MKEAEEEHSKVTLVEVLNDLKMIPYSWTKVNVQNERISAIMKTMTSTRPTLKSCSFPTHQLGEIKNRHKPPAGRNFFTISLSEKIYD